MRFRPSRGIAGLAHPGSESHLIAELEQLVDPEALATSAHGPSRSKVRN
jgi:hypothetical protein